jgi:hypothetical protein
MRSGSRRDAFAASGPRPLDVVRPARTRHGPRLHRGRLGHTHSLAPKASAQQSTIRAVPANPRTMRHAQPATGERLPVYVVRLQSPDGADARRLRWFLKSVLRRLGLRCLSIEIEVPR